MSVRKLGFPILFFLLSTARVAHALPVLSNIRAMDITATEAWINWTTDVIADEQVDYGTTAQYGASGGSSFQSRNHLVHLISLTPGTLYHFRVRSTDITGTAASADFTFTTYPLPGTGRLQGRLLKDDNGNGVFDAGESYIRDPLAAPCVNNDTAQAGLGISLEPGTQQVSGQFVTPTVCDALNNQPTYVLDLPPGSYVVRVSSSFMTGWNVTSADRVPVTITNGGTFTLNFAVRPPPPVDIIAPKITNMGHYEIGSSSVAIYWETDEQAFSRIEYGPTTSYGQFLDSGSLAIFRVMRLTGLSPNTLYHYRMSSWDVSNNIAYSLDFSFTTLAASNRCDLDNTGSVDVVDVQQSVVQAIQIVPCSSGDINQNGQCDVVDVQRVVNAALGGQCVTQ